MHRFFYCFKNWTKEHLKLVKVTALLLMIAAFDLCYTGCSSSETELTLTSDASKTNDSDPAISDSMGSLDPSSVAETEEEASTAQSLEENASGENTENKEVVVYVCGAVKEEGVYHLAEGARICDAVDAAGGMTDDAAKDTVNQAAPVTDGEMLKIPTQEEADAASESGSTAWSEGQDGGTGTAGNLTDSNAATSSGKVNINTADTAQLETIPGVGKARAEAIISYRENNGRFASAEDIMKVSGIKQASFEKMKDYICVN